VLKYCESNSRYIVICIKMVDLNGIFMDEYERYYGSAAEGSGMESLKSDNKYALVRRWSTPRNCGTL